MLSATNVRYDPNYRKAMHLKNRKRERVYDAEKRERKKEKIKKEINMKWVLKDMKRLMER